MYIRAETSTEAELFTSQVPTFLALTKNCKSVEVVRDISGVPEGCGSEVLTPTIFTHILVRVCFLCFLFLCPCPLPTSPQGQVDLDGEINKCEKKLALAKMNLSKIEKIEAQGDYESTVPENVRLANEDKVYTFSFPVA